MGFELFLITISPWLFVSGYVLEIVGAFFLYKQKKVEDILKIKNPKEKGFLLLLLGFAFQLISYLIQNFLGVRYGDMVHGRDMIFFAK
jgi:hypothetical protein